MSKNEAEKAPFAGVNLGEDAEKAPISPKKSKGPGKLLIGVSVVALAIVGGAFMMGSANLQQSDLPKPQSITSTPGGVNLDNRPDYKASLDQFNNNRADKAEELEITYIQTPSANLQEITGAAELDDVEVVEEEPEVVVPEPEPEPIEEPVAVKRRVLVQPPTAPAPAVEKVKVPVVAETPTAQSASSEPQQAEENPYSSLMRSQVAGVVSAGQAVTPNVVALSIPTGSSGDTVQSDYGTSDETADIVASEAPAAMLIAPGDILYAETLVSANSDAASPILAKITTGKFKDGRLVGSFSTDDSSDKMVVKFSKMTFEGESYNIEAYAIDGTTSETSVRSGIDRRLMKRYGPILAASFLGGFATSAAAIGTATSSADGITTVEQLTATQEQSLYAGVASATGVIAEDIASNVARGPLVRLDAGYGIGVIFTSEVTE